MSGGQIAPPAFLNDPALRAVLAALPEARLVGGCVRDTIAGHDVSDIDLATPRLPAEVMDTLAAAGLRGVPTGIHHGTITAVSGGRGFEVTTLRRDIATDGRHATVAFGTDWREDAARRDFTFNAMSLEPDGTVHDWFGGRADLAAGIVRFVGDPARRVAEDRLRVPRFFRFYARYGTCPPDAATRDALAGADLSLLSVERVRNELIRILEAPDPRAALRLMDALGVLPAVMPQPVDVGRLAPVVAAELRDGTPPDPMLRLAALAGGDATPSAAALKLSGVETKWLTALAGSPLPNTPDDATLRRLLAGMPKTWLIGRALLHQPDNDALRRRIDALAIPVFPLAGRDAVAAGIAPGPAVGAALEQVRRWWLEGGCMADRQACLARLRSESPSISKG